MPEVLVVKEGRIFKNLFTIYENMKQSKTNFKVTVKKKWIKH